MDLISLFLLSVATIVASMYGTLVGGPSLLTIPILIYTGLSPIEAVATNRVGLTGIAVGGLYKFSKGKKKRIDTKLGFILGTVACVGAICGALLVLEINEDLLKNLIAVFTIMILSLIVFKPNLGVKKTKKTITLKHHLVGTPLSFINGIYGGFYGAGIGTFFAFILILIYGKDFIDSAATRKIPILLISLSSAAVFMISGVVNYYIVALMLVCSFIGSYIGVAYAEKIGNLWIKRIFIGIVILFALKLLFL